MTFCLNSQFHTLIHEVWNWLSPCNVDFYIYTHYIWGGAEKFHNLTKSPKIFKLKGILIGQRYYQYPLVYMAYKFFTFIYCNFSIYIDTYLSLHFMSKVGMEKYKMSVRLYNMWLYTQVVQSLSLHPCLNKHVTSNSNYKFWKLHISRCFQPILVNLCDENKWKKCLGHA